MAARCSSSLVFRSLNTVRLDGSVVMVDDDASHNVLSGPLDLDGNSQIVITGAASWGVEPFSILSGPMSGLSTITVHGEDRAGLAITGTQANGNVGMDVHDGVTVFLDKPQGTASVNGGLRLRTMPPTFAGCRTSRSPTGPESTSSQIN